jgi:hypothetical protein
MSTIKITVELEQNDENIKRVLTALIGSTPTTSTNVKTLEVVDAEEVNTPPAKTPTPRPSRAKAKPAPVEEEIEDEDEEFETGQEGEGDLDDEEEAITADDLRALQAAKIDKHRPAIAAHYGKLGAKGISSLAPENFQKMFDFLSKLK